MRLDWLGTPKERILSWIANGNIPQPVIQEGEVRIVAERAGNGKQPATRGKKATGAAMDNILQTLAAELAGQAQTEKDSTS